MSKKTDLGMQAMTQGILGLPDEATHRVRSPGKAAALAPNSGGKGPWKALSARFSVCSAVMFARLAGSRPTAGTEQSGFSHAICLHSAPVEALSTASGRQAVTAATLGSVLSGRHAYASTRVYKASCRRG